MNKELTQAIASEVQLFYNIEQKENFLFLLGALRINLKVEQSQLLKWAAGSVIN